MRTWQKKGLIFAPDGRMPWAQHTALTPTPFRLSQKVIRVFAGFRDDQGVSRIGFVDVDAFNPNKVLGVSDKPVLGTGKAGCFDDNGVILKKNISLSRLKSSVYGSNSCKLVHRITI